MYLRISRIVSLVSLAACPIACSANGDQLLGKVMLEEGLHTPEASVIMTPGDAGDTTCTPQSRPAKELGLDFQLLVDRSQSMFGGGQPTDKWDSLVPGLKSVLASGLLGNSGIGLAFYPVAPPFDACFVACQGDCGCLMQQCGCTFCPMRGDTRGCGRDTFSCDAKAYDSLDVEIGPVADNLKGLQAQLDLARPGGPTVLRPALEGALIHANEWRRDHPDRRIAEIVVAGGPPTPEACDPDGIGDCATAAGSSSNRTYVIAFGASSPTQSSLDPIAASGGTKKAYLVTDTRRDNVNQKLTDLFRQIISDAQKTCEYALPETDSPFDQGSVNLELSASMPVYQVQNRKTCGQAALGWYYDSSEHPTRIIACDPTCDAIRNGAQVRMKVGCPTEPAPVSPP